jgi:hypothetical protein
MSNLAISSLPQVQARAHLIADRIDLKNFKITDSLATTPPTVTVGGADGIAEQRCIPERRAGRGRHR